MTTSRRDVDLHDLLVAAVVEPWREWYTQTRLVLADLLEERGDVRADAVRSADCEVRVPRRRRANNKRAWVAAGTYKKNLSEAVRLKWFEPIELVGPSLAHQTYSDPATPVRQQVLALFPGVTLRYPCPLCKGEPVLKDCEVWWANRRLRPDYCFYCAGRHFREEPAEKVVFPESYTLLHPDCQWDFGGTVLRNQGTTVVTAPLLNFHTNLLRIPDFDADGEPFSLPR